MFFKNLKFKWICDEKKTKNCQTLNKKNLLKVKLSKIRNHHSMRIPYILGVMSLFCAKSHFERVFLFFGKKINLSILHF